jgi:protein ImuB
MQRFLVITLPHWPVTARARLVQGPVVVVVRRKGARMVHAASRLARADGVERGMPLAQAKALARSEPLELDHDHAADRRALSNLARWCQRISPLVQPVHDDDHAAIVIDLTGLERVHRGEDRLLVRLRAHMDRMRVECTLWTASTQAAAGTAGRAAPSGHDGIIKRGEERWRTRACPIDTLRIDRELVAMLHEVNVRTIDDLRQVQRNQVAARFGQRLLDRLDAIQGLVLEPFRAIRCVPEVQGQVIFDGPCPQVEALCQAVQSCFEQVCTQLQDRGRGARAFRVRVRCCDLPEHAWTIRCTQPIRSWHAVRPLVLPSLQDLPLGHGVEAVHVIARSLRRVASRQGGLQGACNPAEHGALWIDSLRERFGPDAVSMPILRAVRRHAWHEGTVAIDASIEGNHDDRGSSGGVNGIRGIHGLDGLGGMGGAGPAQASVHALASEPSCVWPQPELIIVQNHRAADDAEQPACLPHAAPDHDRAHAPWPMPPSCFRWQGAIWRTIAFQGPQRLVGAWWQAHDAGTRDHWRVHATRIGVMQRALIDGHASTGTAAPCDHAWLALVRHDDGSWWVQGAWT